MRISRQEGKFAFEFARKAQPRHTLGMATFAEKIRRIRLALGFDQKQFAAHIGASQGSVSKWESGISTPKFEMIRRVADALQIPFADIMGDDIDTDEQAVAGARVQVIGEVEAGVWKDAMEWDADDRFPVVIPGIKHRSGLELFALRVRGPSMNRVFPDGAIVVVVRTVAVADPRSGDFVVVQRRRDDGTIEATLKQLEIDETGHHWAWPRSTSPTHQSPIALSACDDGQTEEIEILGVVVASIRYESRPLAQFGIG